MSTKQQVLKAVDILGATVKYGRTDNGVFEILIDAPNGQHWMCDGIHQLVESQWDNEPIGNLWQDALDRIGYGLEVCDPDDPNCQDAQEIIETAQEIIHLNNESEIIRG